MVDEMYKIKDYYPTIGIECHVQLKTATKLFAAVDNDAREAATNTLVSHICFGLPGALPVLNAKAVELAAKAAFALQTEPQRFSKFDRKHYFYPDLPMGYQITQYDQPIILGGSVTALVNGQKKRTFTIARAHLEADAGKSTHTAGKDYSLVDLNRAGTPLLEIVSDPCMHSAEEAKAYASELYLIMKHADVSDVNLFYGNMRFDVNVSVSKDPTILGTRTETKNLNSFRAVYDAVTYEIKRQIEILETGQKVVQETRGWQEDKGKTFSQRSKEDAHDYRYFPDPDLPPVVLDDAFIDSVRSSMPTMPYTLREQFSAAGIDTSLTETILNEPIASSILRYVLDAHGSATAKIVASWMGGHLLKLIEAGDITYTMLEDRQHRLVELAQMQSEGMLSSSAAKELLCDIVKDDKDPKELAQKRNILQLSDASELETVVEKVLAENEKAAKDVAEGEMKAIGFLVGQTMKASGGKANPGMVQDIIKKKLGI